MEEYILFMHDDVDDRTIANDGASWGSYFGRLKKDGHFNGGSAIGPGICMNKKSAGKPSHDEITGFIRVSAENLEAAKLFVQGNPVYEAGGTVEIRHLPRDE